MKWQARLFAPANCVFVQAKRLQAEDVSGGAANGGLGREAAIRCRCETIMQTSKTGDL